MAQPSRDTLSQMASSSGDGGPLYMEGLSTIVPLNFMMPMDSIASFAGAVMGK